MKKEKKKKETKTKAYRSKKTRVSKVILIGGWLLLFSSIGFGIYNNITAISTYTIHEKEIIKETLIDTTGLENFVKRFGTAYFTVYPTTSEQDQQRELVNHYLADNLSMPATLPAELKEAVKVESVSIWSIEKTNDQKDVYQMILEVELRKDKETFTRAYSVDVYVSKQQFAVVKLPVLARIPQTASIEVKETIGTGVIDADKRETVENFLSIFFAVYPKADFTELLYYGRDLTAIETDLTFLETTQIKMNEDKGLISVNCTVVYKDNETELILEMPYQLTLEQTDDGRFTIKELR